MSFFIAVNYDLCILVTKQEGKGNLSFPLPLCYRDLSTAMLLMLEGSGSYVKAGYELLTTGSFLEE